MEFKRLQFHSNHHVVDTKGAKTLEVKQCENDQLDSKVDAKKVQHNRNIIRSIYDNDQQAESKESYKLNEAQKSFDLCQASLKEKSDNNTSDDGDRYNFSDFELEHSNNDESFSNDKIEI